MNNRQNHLLQISLLEPFIMQILANKTLKMIQVYNINGLYSKNNFNFAFFCHSKNVLIHVSHIASEESLLK